MGALRQAIYIAIAAAIITPILGWIASALMGDEFDATDVWVALIFVIVAAILPAYLVISKGWGR